MSRQVGGYIGFWVSGGPAGNMKINDHWQLATGNVPGQVWSDLSRPYFSPRRDYYESRNIAQGATFLLMGTVIKFDPNID
jgi:hypothetical protein